MNHPVHEYRNVRLTLHTSVDTLLNLGARRRTYSRLRVVVEARQISANHRQVLLEPHKKRTSLERVFSTLSEEAPRRDTERQSQGLIVFHGGVTGGCSKHTKIRPADPRIGPGRTTRLTNVGIVM